MKSIVIGTTVGILAVALPAIGQASYEIGYTFNGGPEVVRTEALPFSVHATNDDPPDHVSSQLLGVFFPFDHSGAGVTATRLRQILRSESPSDALVRARASVRFTDLVFSGPRTGTISVDLRVLFSAAQIPIPSGESHIGMEYEFVVLVRIGSQEFEGRSRIVITDGAGGYSRVRGGFLVDLPADRVVTIQGIEVPLNESVAIEIETITSLLRPAGSTGHQMSISTRLPETGFPIDRDVFIVPDGVRVDSPQARIENNQWRFCQADLDHDRELTLFDFLEFSRLFGDGAAKADFDGDGDLTVFDFLAFQNRFDAGCRFVF